MKPERSYGSGHGVMVRGCSPAEMALRERIAELERTLKALRASYEERGIVIQQLALAWFD